MSSVYEQLFVNCACVHVPTFTCFGMECMPVMHAELTCILESINVEMDYFTLQALVT